MTHSVDFETMEHDPRDPNPWLALYLDHSIPVDPEVKKAWLKDSSSRCRQFALPIVRLFARGFIMLMQLVKTVLPDSLTSSWLLHRVLSWGLRTFVTREANWLILRHFHIGSEILDFIARNVADTKVPLNPLRPANLADVRDDLFLKHDLNLFNFVINLNRELRIRQRQLETPADRLRRHQRRPLRHRAPAGSLAQLHRYADCDRAVHTGVPTLSDRP